jgi:hypothetical protein
MTMAGRKRISSLLTVRIDSGMARTLAREAKRRGTTRSELARSLLAAGLSGESSDQLAREARRQSLLVSRRRSEKDVIEFVQEIADTEGWR